MPTIELRMDISGLPHSFIIIDNGAGFVQGYGFAPAVENAPWGPGHIYPDTDHPYNYTTGPIQITNEQYIAIANKINSDIQNPPYYNLLGSVVFPGTVQQCAQWVVDVAQQGNVPLPFSMQIGGWNPYGQAIWFGADRLKQAISDVTNSAITAALNWVPPRRDPLVLDLDGGGITTSGIDPSAPIYFDQDGDGMKVATGWIAAGEAIVVRDLDGNGTIDSGLELFGDNTVLQNGPGAGQLADNGFAALADLDADASGVADGKFDSNDVVFSGVRLWKDANQDAVSQADELFTFEELGVASINVSGTAGAIDLGGGNTQTFSGSFTRTDGQVGASGTAHMVGSLLLSNDNFYREFTDDPVWTTEAQSLPQMTGSGAVRDLRPAMSLGTAQALDLQAKVAQFAAAATRDDQQSIVDGLIERWGATSTMQTRKVNSSLTPLARAG